MKQCSRCKNEKSLENFYKDKRSKTGFASYCIECAKDASKAWYAKSEKYRDLIRDSGLRHRFGIDSEEYWRMSEDQKHVCLICKEKGNSKFLHVDHCHTTGNIRGLLCKQCNHGLGNFKDNTKSLQSAIEYLDRNSV